MVEATAHGLSHSQATMKVAVKMLKCESWEHPQTPPRPSPHTWALPEQAGPGLDSLGTRTVATLQQALSSSALGKWLCHPALSSGSLLPLPTSFLPSSLPTPCMWVLTTFGHKLGQSQKRLQCGLCRASVMGLGLRPSLPQPQPEAVRSKPSCQS